MNQKDLYTISLSSKQIVTHFFIAIDDQDGFKIITIYLFLGRSHDKTKIATAGNLLRNQKEIDGA